MDDYLLYWNAHGGWTAVFAAVFARNRRAWRRDRLDDGAIAATIDDVGLAVFNRRHDAPITDPVAYVHRVVPKRLIDAYEMTLDPYELAGWRAQQRAREGLHREEAPSPAERGDSRREGVDRRDLVRYDEGDGDVADLTSERDIDGVVHKTVLQRLFGTAGNALRTRPPAGRTGGTIIAIALAALELLMNDPDAIRVWVESPEGPRRVVVTAMAAVRPGRWGGADPYELPRRAAVADVVWQEFHGRYCQPSLELLNQVLRSGRAESVA